MTQCKAVLESLNSITHDQVSWNIRNSAPTHHQIGPGTTFLEWRLCQKSWELWRCQQSVRWLVMSCEKWSIYCPFDPGTEFIKWLLKFSLSLCFLATLLCKLFSLVRWLILLFFVILIDLETPPPRDTLLPNSIKFLSAFSKFERHLKLKWLSVSALLLRVMRNIFAVPDKNPVQQVKTCRHYIGLCWWYLGAMRVIWGSFKRHEGCGLLGRGEEAEAHFIRVSH